MSTETSIRDRLAKRIAGSIALSDEPGQTMRAWRERFRIPQTTLAEYLGISPSVISDYESGRRKSPGTGTIRRFVTALLALDSRTGGQVTSAFLRLMDVSLVDLNIALAMGDFNTPLSSKEFCERLKCDVLAGQAYLDRPVYGYTVIDVERAVKELNSDDFLKLFGATTERCLIFTRVNTGRAPMVAIKSQEFKPTLVVLHGTETVDRLALELSEQMRIPLAISRIDSLDQMIRELKSLFRDSE
ncbi:MAG: helix-turn-helix domain-containing protein [Candidatus Thorarchaeota archaeon]